jgi:hypothetical protein
MAEITLEESWRQIRVLTGRAEQAAGDRRWSEAVPTNLPAAVVQRGRMLQRISA